MLGGVLACGFTHAGITPLDVAKCNMQVRPESRAYIRIYSNSQYTLGQPHKIHWP